MLAVLGLCLISSVQEPGLKVISHFDGGFNRPDETYALCEGPSGQIVAAGKAYTDVKGKFDFFTQASDKSGILLWRKTYGPVRSGGEKFYGSMSQMYYRFDIADALDVDASANVYVVGSSTLDTSPQAFKTNRAAGAALLSYDPDGRLRFATKVNELSVHPMYVALSGSETVMVIGIDLDVRAEGERGPAVVYSFRRRDGSFIQKASLGLGRTPRGVRTMPDGTVQVVLSTGKPLDYPNFKYKAPMPSRPGSWLQLRLDSKLKVLEKFQFDVEDRRVRLVAGIAKDGSTLTIGGFPDDTDRLTRWKAGKAIWTATLQSDSKHDRVSSAIASNGTTVFVSGGHAPGARNGSSQFVINTFDLETGTPGRVYLTPIYPRGAMVFSPGVLFASETRLLVGGLCFPPNDAWVGYWELGH